MVVVRSMAHVISFAFSLSFSIHVLSFLRKMASIPPRLLMVGELKSVLEEY